MENAQILEQVAKKSGKTSQEIQQLIEKKKQKFSGLLTDSGAAFMIAKELGIELGLESIKRVTISQLKDGMQNLDLLVRVMQVFAPKEFEKNGKRGKLCNLVVADTTGEIRLTIWHDDVKKIQENQVKRGTVLLLKNCYVKSFNEKLQASLAYNGSIEVEPDELFADLPDAKSQETKIEEMAEGMNDINVIARVFRKYPATEFDKGERKGKVMNILIGDKTGTMRATAWNDLVEQTQKIQENEVVRIEGAYIKKGLNGLELHMGWQARIEKEQDTGILPTAEKLAKEQAEKKKIIDLTPGQGNILLEAKIKTVNPGNLHYSICPKCGGKIHKLDEGIICDKCGEVKEPGIRQVVSVRVDDGSAQVNLVAYGKEAEKITGLSNHELKKQVLERGAEQLIEELQSLNGKKVAAVGKAKQNDYSNELEFTANSLEIG